MVPVSLFLWLAAEIAIWLALVHGWLGLPWPTAALATLAGILGLRACMVATTWVFAAAFGDAPPLGPWRWLRMVVAEYLAFLFLFLAVIPFERLWMGRDRLAPCRRPILLVHGYACSRGMWWWLRRRLEGAGYVVATVSLTPPYTSIAKLVPQLARRVDEVCAATEAEKLILVAHSMGGLVCRSYLARFGGDRVERLITLATPHAGTELARVGIGQNAREMEPGSVWLRDLNAEPAAVPVVALRNRHDNFVMPDGNQSLPGAEEVTVDGTGHLAMLFSEETAGLVMQQANRFGSG